MKDKFVSPRPGFTEKNAKRFVQVFNSLIECNDHQKDYYVDPAKINLSISTAYQRISEALLWLTIYPMENAKYKPEDYATLRGQVKFRPELRNNLMQICCHFKENFGRLASENITAVDKETALSLLNKTHWRQRVVDYLTNGEVNKPLVIDGIKELGYLLTPADIEWLDKTLDGIDVERTIKPNLIWICK
jgi:hypothetical protein